MILGLAGSTVLTALLFTMMGRYDQYRPLFDSADVSTVEQTARV